MCSGRKLSTMDNPFHSPEADTHRPQRSSPPPQTSRGTLVIFWPPIVYAIAFLLSEIGIRDFYNPGGWGGGLGLWILGNLFCFWLLPPLALLQLALGIWKVCTKRVSGQLHVYSFLIVFFLTLAYLGWVSMGNFPTV